MRNIIKRINKPCIAILVFLAVIVAGVSKAYAETLPTFQSTDETREQEATAFVGEVTEYINVRESLAKDTEPLYDPLSGKKVLLRRAEGDKHGDYVAVMGEAYAEDGTYLYEIRWISNDMEFHGYANPRYIRRTDEVLVPIATPTPSATPTLTPTPTNTPAPTSSPTPKPTPTPMAGTHTDDIKTSGKVLIPVLVIVAVMVVLVIAYAIFVYVKRRQNSGLQVHETIDNLRRAAEQKPVHRPVEHPARNNNEDMAVAEHNGVKGEAKKQNSTEVSARALTEAIREKEEIKRELDSLEAKDIVIHKYFGEGIVIDNSDVNNVEVKFGGEIRFINKESAASKKLMRKL